MAVCLKNRYTLFDSLLSNVWRIEEFGKKVKCCYQYFFKFSVKFEKYLPPYNTKLSRELLVLIL